MEMDAMLLRVAMGWLVSAGALGAQAVQRVAVHVGTDATAQYRSVESAVQALPSEGGLVLVAPGTYRERVWVKQSHVTIASTNKDASKTRIVFDLSQGTQKEANSPIPGMATVTVTGDDFHAENITIENDFNRTHEQVSAGSQAQALNLTGDRNVLRNVRILGNQDTLYIGAKGCGQAKTNDCTRTRTYIDHSYISGNVDFIYGDAVAYFEGCEVHSTKHAGGYLTAQSKHYAGQDSVFVFDHTLLTADSGVQHVFLGRPWRDLANVVFLHTKLGPHIDAKGWSEWHAGETHRLDTAFYAEFDTRNADGTATDVSQRPVQTHQLNAAEAAEYSAEKVLGGWRP
jgi:pectin methylesterase-like acyl-CoA thioesterase